MCSLATSMVMTNITLLWWTLDSVLLLVVIKLKAVKEALQWSLGHRLSKHKLRVMLKVLGGMNHWPPKATPMHNAITSLV